MLHRIATALLELVYPPRCAACGEEPDEEPFCPICADAVDPVPPGCVRCGLPGSSGLCGGCAAAPPAFESLSAGGLFGGPLADAVHAFKYGERPALARPLGEWLAGRVEPAPDARVVEVPLARRRRIARGYDQAALLADALARAWGAPRLRLALTRVRETAPQVGKTREARRRNVAGAFEARRVVAGLDLVLVDDVVTTGATADSAASALLRAGARSVRVVALGRAD